MSFSSLNLLNLSLEGVKIRVYNVTSVTRFGVRLAYPNIRISRRSLDDRLLNFVFSSTVLIFNPFF